MHIGDLYKSYEWGQEKQQTLEAVCWHSPHVGSFNK